jgi:pimeloyl-ACP methyl ester carboxylesterase
VSAPAPISRRIHLATDLDYHLLEWNPGAAHTVVLIHGFLDLSWGWAPMVAAGDLATRFHVVAPDMRGHGDSDRVGPGGYYHFMDYLADLHALIDALEVERVSLVGHSMGGSITGYYAGTYPDRIRRLAILEGMGPPEMTTPVPDRVAGWIDGWRRARAKPMRGHRDVASAAARLRKHDALLTEELSLLLAEHGTAIGPAGDRVFKHDPLHATMGPYPYRVDVAMEFWRRVSCPVLLIDADQSSFRHAAEEMERRASAFAQRDHRTIVGAGHMMQRHQPKALADMLTEFLSD